MSTLRIENFDDALMKEITDLASENRLSVEEQTINLLKQTVYKQKRLDRTAVLEDIAAMTPKNVRQTDSVEMLREDRDR